jgi:hypothetical protein
MELVAAVKSFIVQTDFRYICTITFFHSKLKIFYFKCKIFMPVILEDTDPNTKGARPFCQLGISSNYNYDNMAFCQVPVSSTCHFVNLSFCQHCILSTCHFVNLPFCQHFVNVALGKSGILSTRHFFNSLLHKLDILLIWLFDKLNFCQLVTSSTCLVLLADPWGKVRLAWVN